MKFMNTIFLFFFMLLSSVKIWATVIIDVYGEHNEATSRALLSKYGDYIGKYAQDYHLYTGTQDIKKITELKERRRKILADIKKDFNYLYVGMGDMYYQIEPEIYVTIEVISKEAPWRTKFITPEYNFLRQKNHVTLVDEMIEFDKKIDVLHHQDKLRTLKNDCPYYHCIVGYNYAGLQNYVSKFKQSPKYKKLLLQTLKNNSINSEQNSLRREAAINLIGFFKNPHEIIKILLPYVEDKDYRIRNAAMRVIVMTLYKSKITSLDPAPFMRLLNSPYTTDRNKALYILRELAATHSKIIREKSSKQLLDILKLKQLNNHEPAYDVLKIISGRDYAADDFNSWSSWCKNIHQDNKNTLG